MYLGYVSPYLLSRGSELDLDRALGHCLFDLEVFALS